MLQLDGLPVLLTLMIGHLLGDFFLQPNSWVQDKNQHKAKSRFLYYHALLHGAITALILLFIAHIELPISLLAGGLVALSHGAIDYGKTLLGKGLMWFLLDQALHTVILIIIWLSLFNQVPEQIATYWHSIDQSAFILLLLAYLLMLKPASIVIGEMLSKWSHDLTHNDQDTSNSLKNAGQYLGYIERLLVLTFVLNGQYTAVGFVLAAKSIFRMGDLREAHDRKFTEYVMLGSLFSTSLALFTGLIVSKWLS